MSENSKNVRIKSTGSSRLAELLVNSEEALREEFGDSPEAHKYEEGFENLSEIRFDLFKHRKRAEYFEKRLEQERQARQDQVAALEAERQSFAIRLEHRDQHLTALESRLKWLENEKNELHGRAQELAQSFANLERERNEFELSKSEQFSQTLSRKAADYVSGILLGLDRKATAHSNASSVWSVVGALLVSFGVIFSMVSIGQTATVVTQFTWPQVVLLGSKTAVFFGAIGLGARYCYLLAERNFNASKAALELKHDLSFGNLYVETYGASGGWEKIREAFSNWHRAGAELNLQSPKPPLDNNESSLEAVASKVDKIAEALTKLSK